MLCCVRQLCTAVCTQYEQFFNLSLVRVRLIFVFFNYFLDSCVFLLKCLFVLLCVSVLILITLLLCCWLVLLSLVFSVPSLFCVEWDVKPCSISISDRAASDMHCKK